MEKAPNLSHRTQGLPDIPVVVMTSHGSEQIAVDVMKSGAIDYVVKSETTFAEMPHISTRALRQWRTMRDHARAEQALHDNQEELELALEAARAGVWSYDIVTPGDPLVKRICNASRAWDRYELPGL